MRTRATSGKLLLEWSENPTASLTDSNSQRCSQNSLLTYSSIEKRRPVSTPFENYKNSTPPGHDSPSHETDSFHESTMEAPRIMVVDDEPDMARVMKYGLTNRGFKVNAFTDPLQALDQFKPGQYNVVLLDIRMPKMDGIELYRRMRSMDNDVVICFVSAYEQYKRQFEIAYPQEQAGCFIPKPVRIDSLAAIISSIIEERRSLRN